MDTQSLFLANNDMVKIIATNSNRELAVGICKQLHLPLTASNIVYHGNTEIKVQILENVRGHSVYIIASGSNFNGHSVNDHLMEVLCLADACKRSDAKSICLIIPCFPYARSDKKDDGRCSISSALTTNLLITSGITRIIAVDLHSGQIQGFTNLPFDNLYAINLFCSYIVGNGYNNPEKYILVSPDLGGSKRIVEYAKRLKMPYAIMNKQRDYTKESTVDSSMLLSDTDYKGKVAVIIDDILDTCSTMIRACEELKSHGLESAIIIATHGVFSKDATDKLIHEFIRHVVVTNSLPIKNGGRGDYIHVLDLSPLLSQVIYNLEMNKSISKLFK